MTIALIATMLTLPPSVTRADIGVLYLTDGTVMRGDLTESDSEVVLRNALGETRVARDRVERITWIESEPVRTPQPTSRPAVTTAPADAAATEQPVTALLSPGDVLRIQLSELPLDGQPERVAVRFLDSPDQPDVPELVLTALADREDVDPTWATILSRGKPHEKLQVVLSATGLEYADRIELRGETDMFGDFRRRVLPHVLKGCARSGCHTGPDAPAIRFPTGTLSDRSYVATMYHLLETTVSQHGPLLNRKTAEDSVLIQYLLPPADDIARHPTVPRTRLTPVLRGPLDRRYLDIVEWVRSLRSPHPDYGLSADTPTSQPAAPID
jgi:hypothetical protein